ncbi:MAG: DUF202 domain-containing protein [Actinobacteria bacterium]|nr:DUF202 domain-containing protein [Actinomycetota bacterium]
MRFPGSGRQVLDVGHDPDYRFSLANERTFLAWIRTALALMGGGLAVVSLLPSDANPALRDTVGLVLVVLGTLVAATSYRRWSTNEVAMRTDRPIPASVLPLLLSIGVLLVAVLAAALLIAIR